jgi:hypothetical protein
MKPSNEPAKLADRVIAPGDGPAEPGERNRKRVRATKCATDAGVQPKLDLSMMIFIRDMTNQLSPASQALGHLRL